MSNDTNYTTTPLRCPDCHATLDIPVIVHGLERGEDGKRVLSFEVQDNVFEPYIQRHMGLSEHPKLADAVGDDWATDEASASGTDAAALAGPGVVGTEKPAAKS